MNILNIFTHASTLTVTLADPARAAASFGAPGGLQQPSGPPSARGVKLYHEPDTYFITQEWTTVTSR